MSERSARSGHIKRRLVRGQPLTGKLLELALECIGEGVRPPGDELFSELSRKFRAGIPLDSYELSMMFDLVLMT